MSEGLDIIFKVWGNRTGYVFTPCKNPRTDEWFDQSYLWPDDKKEIRRWIGDCENEKRNVYWCPTLFKEPIRKKEYITSVQCLWADLDEVDPRKIKAKLKPSLAYQTSPNRYQCLWYLDQDVEPLEAEPINRNITYYLGADKGGWDLTQVLRIPGLHNFKYKDGPKGKLLWNKQVHHDLTYFDFVPEAPQESVDDDDGIEWDEDADLTSLVSKYKKKIRGKLFDLVFASEDEVEESDRSEKLWEMECRLLEAGVDVSDVVNIVRLSNWNKYAGRNDEKKRIITEVMKAKAEVEANSTDSFDRTSNAERFRDRRTGKIWTTYGDLMGLPTSDPGWLIEGWWQKGSHGMVAGEPKTYKSTFVADFAISVASGLPLFGRYDVHTQGPVIMIQEENSPFLMQDRVRKITNHKGLLKGKVKVHNKGRLTVTFPPELPITFLNNKGFDFTDEESRNILETHIQDIKPVLVVFDPLYLMLGGRDENSSKDLRPLLNWLLHIRYDYGTAVMIVHHWNKSGTSSRGGQRMMGSAVLHGWVESAAYAMVKNEEEHEVTVDREFRSFPKPKQVDIKYTMGNPGEDTYDVEIMDSQNATADEIMDILASTNGMSERDLMAATGMGRTALNTRLKALERKGLIYCDKSKRPALWFIVKVEVNEE